MIRRLGGSCVLVVGAGGLGSPVLEQLVAQGCGSVTVCDPDAVSMSNLSRQYLYGPDDEGSQKVDIAQSCLEYLNPECEVVAISDGFKYSDGLVLESLAGKRFDLVVDCTDSLRVGLELDAYCRDSGTALLWGGIEGYVGQVSLLRGRSGLGLSDLLGDGEHRRVSMEPVAVYPSLTAVVGSYMASEAVKWLVGIELNLDGSLLIIDLLNYSQVCMPIVSE